MIRRTDPMIQKIRPAVNKIPQKASKATSLAITSAIQGILKQDKEQYRKDKGNY